MGEDNKKNKCKTHGNGEMTIYSMGENDTHQARVVDLTAYRLEKMLHEYSHDEWMHQALLDILADYYMGLIAIGWENGEPVVIPMQTNVWGRGIPPGFSMVGGDGKTIIDKNPVDYEKDPTWEPDPDGDA